MKPGSREPGFTLELLEIPATDSPDCWEIQPPSDSVAGFSSQWPAKGAQSPEIPPGLLPGLLPGHCPGLVPRFLPCFLLHVLHHRLASSFDGEEFVFP